MSTPLDYSSPQARQRDFALETSNESTTLVFSRVPRWHTLGAIPATFIVASIQTSLSIWMIVRYRNIVATVSAAPTTMPIDLPIVPAGTYSHVILCLGLWFAAVLTIRSDRRWANAVRSVELNAHDLIWSRVSHVARREKRYGASQIMLVETNPVKDILGRKYFSELRFKRRNGHTLRWRFQSSDPTFADRVLTAFRAVLHSTHHAQTDPHQTRPAAG